MRTIKFKGKTDGGLLLIGDLIHRNGSVAISPFGDYSSPFGFKVEPSTVGQFTGFTDAEGQEIYEGDTLMTFEPYDLDETDETEYHVEWDGVHGGWIVVPDNGVDWLDERSSKGFVAVAPRGLKGG